VFKKISAQIPKTIMRVSDLTMSEIILPNRYAWK